MKKLLVSLVMGLAIYGVAIAAVNINTATKEELTSLKGIGEKRAQDIIDYRTKNGGFKSVDDLEKVPGIGPGTMKQIRSQISITGKTTIDKPATAPAKTSDTKKAGDTKTAKADATKTDKSKSDDKAKATTKADEKK